MLCSSSVPEAYIRRYTTDNGKGRLRGVGGGGQKYKPAHDLEILNEHRIPKGRIEKAKKLA